LGIKTNFTNFVSDLLVIREALHSQITTLVMEPMALATHVPLIV